jgi:glucose 1-dehydrogenase
VDTVIGINLIGQFLFARAATREFKRGGVRAAGKLILSSVQQVIPWVGHANCAASKRGVKLLMKSITQELAPHFFQYRARGDPHADQRGRKRLR